MKERSPEVYGEYHRSFDFEPCAVPACDGKYVSGHHLDTVGSGGQDLDGEVPLCGVHHSEVETIGPSRFEAKYKINLWQIAYRYLKRWHVRSIRDPVG